MHVSNIFAKFYISKPTRNMFSIYCTKLLSIHRESQRNQNRNEIAPNELGVLPEFLKNSCFPYHHHCHQNALLLIRRICSVNRTDSIYPPGVTSKMITL